MDGNNLMRLAKLLGMASTPSHGYTISEAGPEIVTAPGVYFPAQKGEVIPLESRAKGGEVSPQIPDKEQQKLDILKSITSSIKVNPDIHIEPRQEGGEVNPMGDIEKSKYDIFKAVVGALKPQPVKPQSPATPSLPSTPPLPGLPKPTTPSSYGLMPNAIKPNEGEALWQKNKELGIDSRAGVLDLTSRQFGGPVTPEEEELEARRKWAMPGYPEERLENARKILGPSVFGVSPGYEKSYYEADIPGRTEERFMDEQTARMKPLTDAITKAIEDERTRQQGYGLGFGPTPNELRLGRGKYDRDIGSRNMPLLLEELRRSSGGEIPRTVKGATERLTPHWVQAQGGEYVGLTPQGILPTGIMGTEKQESSIVDDRKYRDIQTKTTLGQPVSEADKAWASSYEKQKTLSPRFREEMEEKNLLDDKDAGWLANKLANKEMVPSQMRTFIGFGSAGQKNLAKVTKNLRQNYPEYNFALAELSYTGDKAEITKNKNLQGTVLSFEKTAIQNAKQVDALSRKIDVSRIPELNRLILAGKTRLEGDEIASQYMGAWRTFINEYARIATSVSGGGVTSDAARKEVEEILSKAYTPEQMQSTVRQLVLEMEHRRYGFEKSLHDVMSNWGQKPEFDPQLPTAESIENIFRTETPLVGKAGKVGQRVWRLKEGKWVQE